MTSLPSPELLRAPAGPEGIGNDVATSGEILILKLVPNFIIRVHP
jgi:hypothetical protein